MTTHRIPYVGDGADGARRSAQIDLEEADGLDQHDPRRDALLASAARWDQQADDLDRAAKLASWRDLADEYRDQQRFDAAYTDPEASTRRDPRDTPPGRER